MRIAWWFYSSIPLGIVHLTVPNEFNGLQYRPTVLDPLSDGEHKLVRIWNNKRQTCDYLNYGEIIVGDAVLNIIQVTAQVQKILAIGDERKSSTTVTRYFYSVFSHIIS